MKFLARFNIDAFLIGIFVMAGLAAILPAKGVGEDILGWAVKIAIGLLFLLYGARLSPQEALEGFKHWRLHTTVLAFTFVLFPLIGLSLRVLAPHVISDELYAGILFMCLVPSTVQSSIAFTSIAKGNVAGAIVSASFSNFIGVFLTPVLVILLMETTGDVHIDGRAIIDIVVQLLVPFMVGQLLRPWLVGWLTRHAAPTKIVDRGSILLVVYAAFSEGMNQGIWSTTSVTQILVVIAVSCLILAVVLFATIHVSRWLGFPWADQIVVIFAGSKKSLASGLPMASVLFAGQSVGLIVLPLMIFHQIQLVVCAILARRYGDKTDRLDALAKE
ncbi:bile acid:sodium symporter family protein [Tomitella biformata]|uniref:bile acid:sodium symporter family protein n=1 Tax=Tomitella biformata TaxID=630403 RepID=UPI0004668F98|nr:bile acid:sodium symporter family protein [Tomitella biformata]